MLPYAPGPKPRRLLGSMADLEHEPLEWLAQMGRTYGDVVRFRFGLERSNMVLHPDGIRHVLQENHLNYRKSLDYQNLKPMFGEGLVTSEGDLWKRQRRLAQPAFHRQRLGATVSVMVRRTDEILQRLDAFASSGEPFDLHAQMSELALLIVSEVLFGADLSGEVSRVGPEVSRILEILTYRMRTLWQLVPIWVPTPKSLRFHRSRALLDRIVNDLIAARRGRPDGPAPGDLLAMLMEARDADTGAGMSDRQLRDEVMTLFLAGHETTANALTWTFMLLARAPAAAARLHSEIDQVLGARAPGFEDLPRLAFTSRVIDESLRLYPPVWVVTRAALAPDAIGGYRIDPGDNMLLSQYLTHRHADFWEHPEVFDPDRFLPERSAGRPRFAYFPFGGGPRQCIGNQFALMEAAAVLARIAQRFEISLVPEHRIELDPSITLRPRNGVQVRAQRRTAVSRDAATA
jgi:cytochrome P450